MLEVYNVATVERRHLLYVCLQYIVCGIIRQLKYTLRVSE